MQFVTLLPNNVTDFLSEKEKNKPKYCITCSQSDVQLSTCSFCNVIIFGSVIMLAIQNLITQFMSQISQKAKAVWSDHASPLHQ